MDSMKLGIMQPYFFPYLGYFQLINLVDKFVIYDDVNFIKGGWINRNYILLNNKRFLITVPLYKASPNQLINQTEIVQNNKWKKKIMKSISQSYSKAPFQKIIIPLISDVVYSNSLTISDLAVKSIKTICCYLDITTPIIYSSQTFNNQYLKSQNRVIDICKKERATHYINPIGGQKLYSKAVFQKNGLILKIHKLKDISYQQQADIFIKNLSIIDLMMFNSKEKIQHFLKEYTLI